MRYRLVLEDGTPADPPVYYSTEPGWQAGDEIIASGKTFRVVRVDPEMVSADEAADAYRVLVVRPVA